MFQLAIFLFLNTNTGTSFLVQFDQVRATFNNAFNDAFLKKFPLGKVSLENRIPIICAFNDALKKNLDSTRGEF